LTRGGVPGTGGGSPGARGGGGDDEGTTFDASCRLSSPGSARVVVVAVVAAAVASISAVPTAARGA